MKAPPLLAAAALGLWGLASGQWIIAAALAIVIETARFLPLRVAIDAKAYGRLAAATRIAFVTLLAWQVLQTSLPAAMLGTLTWIPVVFALLLIPQLYSEAGVAPITVLRMFRAGDEDRNTVDLSFPYVGATLLAAGGSAPSVPAFFPGLAIVVGWALGAGVLASRPRGAARATKRAAVFAIARWTALYGIVVALALGIHLGLRALQGQVETSAMSLLGQWMSAKANTDRARTRIGDLGRVKLSDHILMRVTFGSNAGAPLLLRDAGFNRFESGTWTNRGARTDKLYRDERTGAFDLAPGSGVDRARERQLAIVQRLKPPTAPLALPLGTLRIEGLEGDALARNRRGSVVAEDANGLQTLRVTYAAEADRADEPPVADDLQLPLALVPAIDKAAEEAGLAGLDPASALDATRRFFARHFGYSLYLGDDATGGRSLGDFLTRDRVGHCEYFASATVLLLRRAGIPARYATGYAVEEWSELEQAYVVRASHGHAWALAYIDGRWVEVDTTPSEWARIEERQRSALARPLLDLLSWFGMHFDRWRAAGSPIETAPLYWLAAFTAAWFGWRLRGKWRERRRQSSAGARAAAAANANPRTPFTRIEAALAHDGAGRGAGESVMSWLTRLHRSGRLGDDEYAMLRALAALHYRVRFGGNKDDAGRELAAGVERWFAR